MAPTLMVVVGSTRPGRVGLPVARWFEALARADGRFDVDFADLADIALPILDEPNHPRLMHYVHDHTIAWSRRVDSASAYVFVTPEYNHGYTAALKNAIDYLRYEWAFKPLGFVSYGGPAGGTRAVEQLTQVAAALRLHTSFASVLIPNVHRRIDRGGLTSDPDLDAAAARMLHELARLEQGLRELRAQAVAARPSP
jgi:NAD(P)H-dependent FMN reductase